LIGKCIKSSTQNYENIPNYLSNLIRFFTSSPINIRK